MGEDINKEILKLQRKQETTSMSLSEEKRLIKEMEALQASKNLVEDPKDKEIDAVQAQIEEKLAAVKAMGDTEAETRAEMQKMFEERDDIRQRIGDQMDERNTLRQDFREATNKW